MGHGKYSAIDLTRFHFGAPDPSWTPIDEVAYGPSRLVVYQTDCGATCAVGVAVRQEMEVAPGILLVRDVWSRSMGETARVDVLLDGSASVDGTPLSLRWHVYF